MNAKESQELLRHAKMILKSRPHRHGWCLGDTRAALAAVGLKLPPPQPKGNGTNTAIWNGEHLGADPAIYGWQHAHGNEPLVLMYFKGVAPIQVPGIGKVFAGHIAIYDRDEGVLYSCDLYDWSPFWQQHVYASYVPRIDEV